MDEVQIEGRNRIDRVPEGALGVFQRFSCNLCLREGITTWSLNSG